MHIKTPACNALAVANKCRDPLPITAEVTIKMKGEQDKGTHNSHLKNYSQVEFSLNTHRMNIFLI